MTALLISNASLRSVRKDSASVSLRTQTALFMKTAEWEATAVSTLIGLSAVCAQNKRVHSSNALQTLSAKTASTAGLLHQKIASIMQESACLCTVKSRVLHSGGGR